MSEISFTWGLSARETLLAALFIGSFVFVGCAHVQPPTVTSCIPLRTWTDSEKSALKAAFDALPQGSVLALAVEDLTKTREEVRTACHP
jgi:hypothetical protein